ncbi:MAG: zinc ribbon domain-containing protein [Comamonas sp.]
MSESHTLGDIRFSTLARAGEGLTQWRPLLMGFLTLLLAGALISLGLWSAARMFSTMGAILGLLLNLVAVVVVLAGTSGVGAMLMDRAQKVPVRGYLDAGIFGLMCIPKFLGFGLLVALAGLAFFLVAALVYFICKIPVLGAVLAFVAHPLLIMVGAALMVAMLFVVNPLFAPAVWSGLSMKDALVSVIGIASQRLVQVVLMQLVLYVVVGIIGGLLMAGLLPVGLSLTGLAASIMADGEGMMSMMGGFGGGYGGYGGGYGGYGPMGMLGGLMGNGSMVGLALGLGVLLAVLTALMAQVMILGLNLVYLQAQENLDTSDTSSRFNRWLATVLERSKAAAQAAKEKARQVKEATDQKAQEIKAANEERRQERERLAAEKAEHDRVERERQAEENAKQDALNRQAAEQTERERIERERVDAEKAAAQAEIDRKAAAAERERLQEAERKAQALALAEGERQAAAAKEEEATRRAAEQAAQQEEERLRAAAEAKAQADAAAQAKAAAAPSCPSCHSPAGASDAFCGECGHKLK